MKAQASCLGLMLAALFTVTAAQAATNYVLIPLSSSGVAFKHSALAVSSNKRVAAGECFSTSSSVSASCLWLDGNFVAAAYMGQGYGASFSGVNDAGTAVGYRGWSRGISRNLRRAMSWDGSAVVDLPSPFGDLQQVDTSEALGINQAGVAVGWSRPNVVGQTVNMVSPTGPISATVWQGGVARTLPTLGGDASVARAINDLNVIVGESTLADNTSVHATLWRDGQATDLAGGQAAYSVATAINDAGQVVGYARTSATSSDSRAMLWQDGGATMLASVDPSVTSSVASGINSAGLIVGSATLSNGVSQAVLWEGGVAVNLNTRLQGAPSGYVLNHAHAITDDGVIVGDMTNPPEIGAGTTAFMLVPSTTGSPQTSCTVSYKVSKSGSLFFTAQVTLVNRTNSTLTPWAVNWTYAPGGYATVLSSNAKVTIKGNVNGAATPLPKQLSIAPLGSMNITFTALSWGKVPTLSSLSASMGGQACQVN